MVSCFTPGALQARSRGHFNIVHDISVDAAGRVYIADRENHRVQIFAGRRRVLRHSG